MCAIDDQGLLLFLQRRCRLSVGTGLLAARRQL